MQDTRLITSAELAQRWGYSPGTIANQRLRGAGPAFVKLGHRVAYRLQDVEAFELAHRVEPVAVVA